MIDLDRMHDKLEKQLASETPESLQNWLNESEKIKKEIDEAMENEAVTNISGWTLEDSSLAEDDDEEKYRERLARNAAEYHQKIDEAINSIGKESQ